MRMGKLERTYCRFWIRMNERTIAGDWVCLGSPDAGGSLGFVRRGVDGGCMVSPDGGAKLRETEA